MNYAHYDLATLRALYDKEKAELTQALLNGASFIYTRETKTLSILKGAGIRTPVLEFGPDGCFGIDHNLFVCSICHASSINDGHGIICTRAGV